jgi:pyruvate dehydrogenase E2 component (dihydrolipoamide acetyltransferase)
VHVAGLMTTRQITATLAHLETRTYDARSASAAADPATVTVVDLGTYGVADATLDASFVQPAVLTIGAVTDQPVVENGALVPGRVITVTLSCDTSRVDAFLAARWLAHLTELLEQPLTFLT